MCERTGMTSTTLKLNDCNEIYSDNLLNVCIYLTTATATILYRVLTNRIDDWYVYYLYYSFIVILDCAASQMPNNEIRE